MRFQPGQSGNPGGRPTGSLNKKTIAAQAVMEERAKELATDVIDRAKNGDLTAMRLCMEQLVPTGRNRRVAIELPVIKTPEDAELALTVVTDELAAGNLSISEASALVGLIDRMLRLAERMWKFQQAREAAEGGQEAPETEAQAPQTAEKPRPPLYSPVNSGATAEAETGATPAAREGGATRPVLPQEETPLPRAA